MRDMYLSEPTPFDDIFATLADLENRINHVVRERPQLRLNNSRGTLPFVSAISLPCGELQSHCKLAQRNLAPETSQIEHEWTSRFWKLVREYLRCRVEVWRGGGTFAAPFPHPAHRTGRADFPHPALGSGITCSPTEVLCLGTQLDQSQLLVKVLVSEAECPTRIHFVLSTEPLAKPIPNMIIQCPVRGRHRTEAEVAGPTRQADGSIALLASRRGRVPDDSRLAR